MSQMVARVSKSKRCSFTRNGVCKSWKFIKQRECIMYFQLKWINFFSESTKKQRIILLLYASHHGIPKKISTKMLNGFNEMLKKPKNQTIFTFTHTRDTYVDRVHQKRPKTISACVCVCVWLANLWLKSEWTVWKTRRDRGESTRSTVFPFQTNETELTKTKSIWNLLIYFITMPIWESAAHMRER